MWFAAGNRGRAPGKLALTPRTYAGRPCLLRKSRLACNQGMSRPSISAIILSRWSSRRCFSAGFLCGCRSNESAAGRKR
jgi:hypothetical protein